MIPIDLRSHMNAYAATYDRDRSLGTVNAWGNSFPAEELPFGDCVVVDGLCYELAPKAEGEVDHVEALGQVLALRRPATGLALLMFGEMGEQQLDLEIDFADGSTRRERVLANGWLVAGEPAAGAACLRCSHLHYVGGYELALLRPVLWSESIRWGRTDAVGLRLGVNPLFHIVALTALTDDSDA